MYGNILQYITAVILLKYENVCDFDIAGPNMQGGDNIEILLNPTWKCHTVTFGS